MFLGYLALSENECGDLHPSGNKEEQREDNLPNAGQLEVERLKVSPRFFSWNLGSGSVVTVTGCYFPPACLGATQLVRC